jgi:poly-beta-1,6-N-acetyl-D-glucosamine N-deacetylase
MTEGMTQSSHRRFRLLRPVLWAATVFIVITPFTVAWRVYQRPSTDVGVQHDAPLSAVKPSDVASWRALGKELPDRAAPIVISYHDIRPNSTDRYVVSPTEFDHQLTALKAAGYRTLTSDEFVAYLRGGPVPARSVYLTFDDGTSGLYAYADRILQKHNLRAASFLISGRVGRYRPYYLSWREVEQMAASGRWDFQAHTHDLHTRGPVGPKRINGSLLTGSMWVSETRMETVPEHRERILTDLNNMFADFAEHDLPAPAVFAYPFSDANPSYDRGAVNGTKQLVTERFIAAVTNKVVEPTPVSRRAAPGRLFERIEVFSTTRAHELLAQVATWTAIPPDVRDVLGDPHRWWDDRTRSIADLSVLDGRNPGATDALSYLSASYAPYATADWINYTVTAEVRGLQRSGNNGNVMVRSGSPSELAVRTSCCGLQVVSVASGALLAQRRIPAAEGHRITVSVTTTETVIVVDDAIRVRLPSRAGTAGTGGIEVASRRGSSSDWPYFAQLSVASNSH